jgi:hypothetical protein
VTSELVISEEEAWFYTEEMAGSATYFHFVNGIMHDDFSYEIH